MTHELENALEMDPVTPPGHSPPDADKLVRPMNYALLTRPSRTVGLAFVDLQSAGHDRPQRDTDYSLVSAGDSRLEGLPFPQSAQRILDVDVYNFFAGDLPEGIFGGRNEGLLKISAHTNNPQSINEKDAIATWVNEFDVDDDQYAPRFRFRGVFRNVLIGNFANLAFELYEMDKDASEYYSKFKRVIDKVPEVKSLDILKGIPYLNIATGLFEGVIEVFGKNADDHIWGEIPLLEFDPIIRGACLRSGLYVIYERYRKGEEILIEDLLFRNEEISSRSGAKLGAHLIFGLRVGSYSGIRT